MKQTFKTSIAKEIWSDSLNWTFELIDILNKANNGDSKNPDIESSKIILNSAKDKIQNRKAIILLNFDKIDIHVKPVRNFKGSLEKLLNSTEIDFTKSMKIPSKPFDLFDSISDSSLTEFYLNNYIDKVKNNLEISWIAFNQSYGRMLIKMKLNDYLIE
ncbi:MAG: hypothetical protein ACI81T_004455 [Bacteroidia bacterium]|jgi:hypothetical protein